ncbi:bifunctional metallophosphatase/5'-nucleotidase [Geofilum rubicundum]|uniref:5'-nucleotidase n=1 Tax=Geofilum rubicundum JCM 15548 TaxID=1236989 RepID=A0A0E9M3G0_9BACT|nr:metallophosphatase [Geofilum rubicundum]GAO31710.1 5'-nucleotidase [Geofilum rubicundum JCM 15548]
MPNRREFIKKAVAGAALLTLPMGSRAFSGNKETRLVILHTSDVHSHIDPMPMNHTRFPGMGGFAQRAAIVNKIRKENDHVLLLDSGDIFQGTPYFNFYEGSLELKLMTKMGYDAATIGNHEFDNGLESLNHQLQHAGFPFVSANYSFENTPLAGKIAPWLIINRGPVKVGITGLGIDPERLVAPSNYKGMVWSDPISVGDATAEKLKKEHGCDLVIALSHLGLKMNKGRKDDFQLAAESKHIDIILGGHTHTFLDEPIVETNAAGKEILILHSGQNGVRMGRIDLVFSKDLNNQQVYQIETPSLK